LREIQAEATAHQQDARHEDKRGGPFEEGTRTGGHLTGDFN
jgi:hypothetical protein